MIGWLKIIRKYSHVCLQASFTHERVRVSECVRVRERQTDKQTDAE